ncbi:NAD-binding protein [Salmonella enterica]|nr:NAD-binding protein [Salmonella enterica]
MTTGTDFHVGIVGLGSMGMGAARSCLRAGLSTWGADLNPQACANLLAEGACGAAASAREFAGVVDALVILVVNAAQVRQVLFGEDGVAHLMKPGSAVMVSSTISSADAQEIAAALTALNLNMLDAPVSGGAVKAAQGEMTVMASGSEAAFTRLKPVLDAVASNVYRISDTPGAGSTVKIIHQLLAGVHIAAAAEAMALAARAGIPLDVMYDVVTHAAGNSWMFENRMQHVVDGDYTPRSAVDIFVKDLGLVADTAKALRFPLPLASTALNMFTSATASTQALAAIQQQYGATEASHAVEALFSLLAARLAEGGITRFIVAGGETSGVVTQSLGITGFHIGPCISPGVPWVNALHAPVSLALKSGNFGDESFFIRAQREFQI